MSVVDFIFDTGMELVGVFTRVSEWFVTPIFYTRDNPTRLPAWLLEFASDVFGMTLTLEEVAVTPFSVIAGSGLVTVLGYIFVKWVLPIFK